MPNIQKSCGNCEYRVTYEEVVGAAIGSVTFEVLHKCTCPATPWTFIKLTALCEHWEDDGDYEEIITDDT